MDDKNNVVCPSYSLYINEDEQQNGDDSDEPPAKMSTIMTAIRCQSQDDTIPDDNVKERREPSRSDNSDDDGVGTGDGSSAADATAELRTINKRPNDLLLIGGENSLIMFDSLPNDDTRRSSTVSRSSTFAEKGTQTPAEKPRRSLIDDSVIENTTDFYGNYSDDDDDDENNFADDQVSCDDDDSINDNERNENIFDTEADAENSAVSTSMLAYDDEEYTARLERLSSRPAQYKLTYSTTERSLSQSMVQDETADDEVLAKVNSAMNDSVDSLLNSTTTGLKTENQARHPFLPMRPTQLSVVAEYSPPEKNLLNDRLRNHNNTATKNKPPTSIPQPTNASWSRIQPRILRRNHNNNHAAPFRQSANAHLADERISNERQLHSYEKQLSLPEAEILLSHIPSAAPFPVSASHRNTLNGQHVNNWTHNSGRSRTGGYFTPNVLLGGDVTPDVHGITSADIYNQSFLGTNNTATRRRAAAHDSLEHPLSCPTLSNRTMFPPFNINPITDWDSLRLLLPKPFKKYCDVNNREQKQPLYKCPQNAYTSLGFGQPQYCGRRQQPVAPPPTTTTGGCVHCCAQHPPPPAAAYCGWAAANGPERMRHCISDYSMMNAATRFQNFRPPCGSLHWQQSSCGCSMTEPPLQYENEISSRIAQPETVTVDMGRKLELVTSSKAAITALIGLIRLQSPQQKQFMYSTVNPATSSSSNSQLFSSSVVGNVALQRKLHSQLVESFEQMLTDGMKSDTSVATFVTACLLPTEKDLVEVRQWSLLWQETQARSMNGRVRFGLFVEQLLQRGTICHLFDHLTQQRRQIEAHYNLNAFMFLSNSMTSTLNNELLNALRLLDEELLTAKNSVRGFARDHDRQQIVNGTQQQHPNIMSFYRTHPTPPSLVTAVENVAMESPASVVGWNFKQQHHRSFDDGGKMMDYGGFC